MSSRMPDPALPTIHQHPLAYLLGVQGVALMKAFAGEFDADFTAARIAEVRRLLDTAGALGPGVDVPPMATHRAYDGWAPTYDDRANGIFAIEEPPIRALLDDLPAGVAVDAACGTGRHAVYLAELGHTVHGFDSSPAMLALAREKVPGATFADADLRSLPLPAGSADLVVCALALAHVEDLAPVFAEFARVLRPGATSSSPTPEGTSPGLACTRS
jgi:SAM-dependent methyltransferase